MNGRAQLPAIDVTPLMCGDEWIGSLSRDTNAVNELPHTATGKVLKTVRVSSTAITRCGENVGDGAQPCAKL